jgi:hypothetical protein
MIPKKIILHHSLTKDGLVVDWQAIRRYHTSWKSGGKIITKEEAIKIINDNAGLPKNKIVKVDAPWKDIGYHCGIEKINSHHEILLGRLWSEVGAHCYGHNIDSLGICFVGNFDEYPVPEEQWNAGIKLVSFLANLYKIQRKDIYPHSAFADKSCPGKFFDIERFRKNISYF